MSVTAAPRDSTERVRPKDTGFGALPSGPAAGDSTSNAPTPEVTADFDIGDPSTPAVISHSRGLEAERSAMAAPAPTLPGMTPAAGTDQTHSGRHATKGPTPSADSSSAPTEIAKPEQASVVKLGDRANLNLYCRNNQEKVTYLQKHGYEAELDQDGKVWVWKKGSSQKFDLDRGGEGIRAFMADHAKAFTHWGIAVACVGGAIAATALLAPAAIAAGAGLTVLLVASAASALINGVAEGVMQSYGNSHGFKHKIEWGEITKQTFVGGMTTLFGVRSFAALPAIPMPTFLGFIPKILTSPFVNNPLGRTFIAHQLASWVSDFFGSKNSDHKPAAEDKPASGAN